MNASQPQNTTGASGPSPRDKLELVLDAFTSRLLRGENPSIADFIRDVPELSGRIRDVFPALQLLAREPEATASSMEGVPGGEVIGVPQQLGGYRLLRQIGRGGMGVVYAAPICWLPTTILMT